MASTLQEFVSFADATKIDDWTINNWIGKVLEAIKNGATHHAISSGDTSVIGLVWPMSEIEVIVATSDGRSKMRFSLSPGYEDVIDYIPYCREAMTPATSV